MIIRSVIILGLIIGGVVLFWRNAPNRSKLIIPKSQEQFPVVSGSNLERKEIEFPRDFEKDFNLVIIPFKQRQQIDVNTWIPFAQEVEAWFPRFIYYELPTIYEMSTVSRTFINEGMRAGIPDQTARERTITLYLDKDEFKNTLGISTENEIYLYLVDQEGNLLWQTSGVYTEEKARDLVAVIQELR
jgi:hypothetical protein